MRIPDSKHWLLELQCCGSASRWCGCGSWSCLSVWCGSGSYFHFDAHADPDFSLQINVQNFEKCSNRLICHTFWLVICKMMRIRIRILPFNLTRFRIRIHNTDSKTTEELTWPDADEAEWGEAELELVRNPGLGLAHRLVGVRLQAERIPLWVSWSWGTD